MTNLIFLNQFTVYSKKCKSNKQTTLQSLQQYRFPNTETDIQVNYISFIKYVSNEIYKNNLINKN